MPASPIGVLTEFIVTFPAVLAFSLLLAVLSVFSLAWITSTISSGEA